MSNLLGEFLGTMVLVIFGCGVVANVVLKNTKGNNSGWIVITAGWAFAVMAGVFVALATGSVQADINPAVTFAKIFMGVYTVTGALQVMLAQIAGAFAGGCLVFWHYRPYFAVTDDKSAKLGVFSTSPAIRNYANSIYCEILGTFLLTFGIFAIFHQLGNVTQMGPYLVGMLVWAIGLSLGGTTGYAINPARDFGPRLVHAILPIPAKGSSDWTYGLIPLLAPFAGSFIAYVLAKLIGII